MCVGVCVESTGARVCLSACVCTRERVLERVCMGVWECMGACV